MKSFRMKALWVALQAGVALLVTVACAGAAGIKGIELMAGEGRHPAAWRATGPCWSTIPSFGWVLGVGPGKGGGLLNTPGGLDVPRESGVFSLLGEPQPLGPNPLLRIDFEDGRTIQAVFEVQGGPGSGETWRRTGGSPRISVAWGRGPADRVGPENHRGASGQEDYSMVLDLGADSPWTFFWGGVSVVQMVFLPGFVVLLALGLTQGLLRTCLFAFALSLIVNHFVVMILVGCGLYTASALRMLLVVECGLLLWFLRHDLGRPAAALFSGDPGEKAEGEGDGREGRLAGPLFQEAAVVLAGAVLLVFLYKVIAGAGSVFGEWDAAVSWNRWAVEWSQGALPSHTNAYPQLLPSNWSLAYVLMGNTFLQFFAKFIMPLFPLAVLCVPLDLYLRSGRAGYLMGIVLAGALLWGTLGRFSFAGYADLPVAFLALASVYAVLLARRQAGERGFRTHVILGAVFSAGCALTKQAGIYIALAYPFLVHLMAVRGGTRLDKAAARRLLLGTVAVIVVLALPWYVYKLLEIGAGVDRSNTQFLIGSIHHGRSFLGRLYHAGTLLNSSAGLLPLYGLALAGLAFSLRDAVWRVITLLVVLPFLMLWALFFSYDLRNIALAVPFAGIAAGIGIERALIWMGRRTEAGEDAAGARGVRGLSALKGVRLWLVLTALPVFILSPGFFLDEDSLYDKQAKLQQALSSPGMNEALYAYAKQSGFQGKIATFYQIIHYLPGLEDLYAYEEFTSVPAFLQTLENKEVGYLLLDDRAVPEVKQIIKDKLALGELTVVARPLSTYRLIRIERNCP